MAQSCGGTVPEHVYELLAVLGNASIGLGCEGVYQALIEVAEAARQLSSFDIYTPQPNGIGSQFAGAYLMAQQSGQDATYAASIVLHQAITGLSTPKDLVN